MNTFIVIALTELKQSLKLRRTKLILGVALFLCVLFYALIELQYITRAAESASVALMAPTYLAATLGPYFMALFCVAMILFTYDLRGRDIRSGIFEVLDVLPLSNISLMGARLGGLILLLAIPMIAFLVLIILYGWIAETVGVGYGNLIAAHSVASFMIWDLVPNLAFFGALTMFLSTILRSRIAVIVLALVAVIVVFWLFLRIPLDYVGLLATTTGASIFPSEIAPRFVSGEVLLNRLVLVLFAGGLVTLAGCCLSRPLLHRRSYVVGGISALACSILVIGSGLGAKHHSRLEVEDWVRAHDALDASTFPDVINIRGNVAIDPGKSVELDLIMELKPTEANKLGYVVLSLNPGYIIRKLWVGANEVTDYKFSKGILRIPLLSHTKNAFDFRIQAHGRLDERFAYLDAAIQSNDIAGYKVRNLFALGTKTYLLHPDIVVLTSGVRWIPSSGSATGEDQIEERPRDLFEVDLTVAVPKNWIVAGGGHRELIESQDSFRSSYRVAPSKPVPELTLVSSDFERASMVVDGVEFEVLFTKHHRRRFHDLRALESTTRTRILSTLHWYKGAGLVYPHELFSLVEVPTSLRVYGGGWKMDTVMGPPGMTLMRESSLPNTDVPIFDEVEVDGMADAHEKYFTDNDLDLPEPMWLHRLVRMGGGDTRLSAYYRSNVFGEHPTIGFARNFVKNQTASTGTGASTLDHVLEEMVQRLLFDHSPFSGDRLGLDPGRFFVFEVALTHAKSSVLDLFDLGRQQLPKSREELAMLRYHTQSEVWNDLELFSLGELTTAQNKRRSFRVLLVKSAALSRILMKLIGKNESAMLLAQLVSSSNGVPLTYDDIVLEASKVGLDLENTLGDWLVTKGLPGFIVAEPSQRRIPDNDGGRVFEASVIVHNAEPYDGFVDVSFLYSLPDGRSTRREWTRPWSDAFLVRGNESVRLAIDSYYTGNPIEVLYIEPYLSLNRGAIRVDIPPVIDVNKVSDSPNPYTAKIDWSPPLSRAVVVDDMDDTFEIVYENPPIISVPAFSLLRDLVGRTSVEVLDRGLPSYVFEDGEPPPKQRWVRRTDPRAHGRYRHTYTFVHGGRRGEVSHAIYRAELPQSGRWQLEYYMPVEALSTAHYEARILELQDLRTDWYEQYPAGATTIKVVIGEQEETIEFDAHEAGYGWHGLKTFDVDTTNTEVWISGASNKKTVYADAIRWIPLDESK